jgi:hypothetical protein
MLSECLRRYPFFVITITGEAGKHGSTNVYVEGGPSIKHIIKTDRLNNPCGSWSGSAYDKNNT